MIQNLVSHSLTKKVFTRTLDGCNCTEQNFLWQRESIFGRNFSSTKLDASGRDGSAGFEPSRDRCPGQDRAVDA